MNEGTNIALQQVFSILIDQAIDNDPQVFENVDTNDAEEQLRALIDSCGNMRKVGVKQS